MTAERVMSMITLLRAYCCVWIGPITAQTARPSSRKGSSPVAWTVLVPRYSFLQSFKGTTVARAMDS